MGTMQNLLPLLIVLACPLMMIFMMRGMHSGHDATHDATQVVRQDDPVTSDYRAEARIAELEREVAELRDTPAHVPVRLNKPASKS
jgi:hypothetical protein